MEECGDMAPIGLQELIILTLAAIPIAIIVALVTLVVVLNKKDKDR